MIQYIYIHICVLVLWTGEGLQTLQLCVFRQDRVLDVWVFGGGVGVGGCTEELPGRVARERWRGGVFPSAGSTAAVQNKLQQKKNTSLMANSTVMSQPRVLCVFFIKIFRCCCGVKTVRRPVGWLDEHWDVRLLETRRAADLHHNAWFESQLPVC